MASETNRKGGKKKDEDKVDNVTGLAPDTIQMRRLRQINERVFQILGANPEIQELFDKAYAGDYEGPNGQQLFWTDMENMTWWSDNSAPLRRYIIQSSDADNQDFANLRQDAYENVRKTSMQLGMNLSDEQMTETAEKVLMYGWGEPGQEYRLRDEIMKMESMGEYGGDIRANANALQALAASNGVYFDQAWYESAGKSIASEASDSGYWQNQIMEQAMQKFPVFSQQIRAGQTVRQVASPYIQAMAQEWELAPDSIRLDDPTLMGALSNYDEQGNPRAVNLGDFMRQLRKDPRWMETDKAQNEVTGITGRIMQMFGLMGG